MLSAELNRKLTQVGPGTPMGELLRRYWMPFAGVAEFDDRPVRAVRLLGEDLVAFRDLSGTFGLIDRRCQHRRADLSYGFVEQHGLRCNYHGWQFGADGACLAQPFEEEAAPEAAARRKSKKIKNYPVRELAGMLWAYMGPLPAPELPEWEPFTWPNGFRQICMADIPCNWFQCQENSCDPVHFEWMHLNWSQRLRGDTGPYSAKHLKVDFEEFEHGFAYKRLKEGMREDDDLWTIGRVALWPNGFFLGDHFEWRVPIDDENTLSISWMYQRVPRESEPYVQTRIPAWRSAIVDPETGRWIDSHIMNQDFVAWVGQGVVADRSAEELGASDRGIVMMRRRYLTEMEALERGEDPKGVIRDPARAKSVILPVAGRDHVVEGMSLAELKVHPVWARHLRAFPWQAGQPASVWREYAQAMGVAEA